MDLKYDNLLVVQDRVSQEIVKELELNLSPAEAANLKPEKPINGAAYEFYLRGVDLYSLNQFAPAIEMLEKSTVLEPNYAPAWAHLGRAYTTHASLQFGGREDYVKSQQPSPEGVTSVFYWEDEILGETTPVDVYPKHSSNLHQPRTCPLDSQLPGRGRGFRSRPAP